MDTELIIKNLKFAYGVWLWDIDRIQSNGESIPQKVLNGLLTLSDVIHVLENDITGPSKEAIDTAINQLKRELESPEFAAAVERGLDIE